MHSSVQCGALGVWRAYAKEHPPPGDRCHQHTGSNTKGQWPPMASSKVASVHRVSICGFIKFNRTTWWMCRKLWTSHHWHKCYKAVVFVFELTRAGIQDFILFHHTNPAVFGSTKNDSWLYKRTKQNKCVCEEGGGRVWEQNMPSDVIHGYFFCFLEVPSFLALSEEMQRTRGGVFSSGGKGLGRWRNFQAARSQ